ncbi:MAG: hypothetical protein PHS73_04520 [Candidatus Peribacteraceae bacterium]|nr:hypothetical protein [Candidatus Peribacteraceae bacterium]
MPFPFSVTKVLKITVVILFVLLVTDAGGHIIYRVRDGRWLWQQNPVEVFSIRTFTEFVPDDRVITNRKAIVSQEYGYAFDQNRFRVALNDYSQESPNIVFLGDSVPFGWAVVLEEILPSHFYALLQHSPNRDIGVINAAIPSYSLHQSLYRYKTEIHGTFPVHTVILQILDPANQLASYGKAWETRLNATINPRTTVLFTLARNPLYRFSSVFHTVLLASGAALLTNESLDIHDSETKAYFTTANTNDLLSLLQLVREDGGALVLLPVNPTESYKIRLQEGSVDPYFHAVDWLNTIFRNFAQEHDGVYFFDVVDYFDRAGREGSFIDACCHLSGTGAELQAKFLFEQMRKNHLLR